MLMSIRAFNFYLGVGLLVLNPNFDFLHVCFLFCRFRRMSSHSAFVNTEDNVVVPRGVEEVPVVFDVPPLRSFRRRKGGKGKCGGAVGTLAENGPLVDVCALTDAEWAEARRMVSPTVDIMRPEVGSLASSCPSGYFTVHLDAMDHGLRFPLHPFFVEYLNWVGLLPCQVTPNGFYLIAGFLPHYKILGLGVSVGLFMHLFQIELNSSLENQGYALISQRSGRNGFHHTPSSHHEWKHKFVFVCTDREGGLPLLLLVLFPSTCTT
ncbi:unnamed protein product, partial [Cuscuta europaea]